VRRGVHKAKKPVAVELANEQPAFTMGETECRSWRNLPVHGASADLKRNMVTSETIVFVIDDDPSFCRSTEMLIEPAGLSVQAFGRRRGRDCRRLGIAWKPRIFAYVVAPWLAIIIGNLLLIPGYFDVAFRDFSLFLSTLALARFEPTVCAIGQALTPSCLPHESDSYLYGARSSSGTKTCARRSVALCQPPREIGAAATRSSGPRLEP
jgi:hypothetical protein